MASYKMIAKGNWKVTISLGYDNKGKRKRVIKQGFKTKKAAEQFANDTINRNNRGFMFPEGSETLFRDFMTNWFENIKSDTLSINSRNGYISRMKTHILPDKSEYGIGDYKLKELNNDVMQQFYNNLIDVKGMKSASAKKIIDNVHVCLKYALKKKLIYTLPTDIEKKPLDKPTLKVWNQEQLIFFLDYIKDTYLYTPVFIDALTGLRIGELCGLKWQDIDLNKGVIHVKHQLVEDTRLKVLLLTDLKTPSSIRNITIPNILIDYLKDLRAFRNANNNDYVVLNKYNTKYKPRNLSVNFYKKVQRFKMPKNEYTGTIKNYMQLPQITFHGLRHTHATLLIANGENVKVVSERLGHSSVTMTLNTYTHVLDNMKNNTASLLDNMFKKTF